MLRRWSRPKRERTTPTPRQRRRRPSSSKTPSIMCNNNIYIIKSTTVICLPARPSRSLARSYVVSLERIKIRVTPCTTGRRYFSYIILCRYGLQRSPFRLLCAHALAHIIILYTSSAPFVIMLLSTDCSTRVSPPPPTPFLRFLTARKPLNVHTTRRPPI